MKFIKNHLFLISLVMVMVASTFLEDILYGGVISLILLTVCVCLGLLALSIQRHLFWILVVFSLLIIGFNYITIGVSTRDILALQFLSLTILFIIYAGLFFYLIMTTRSLSFSDISNAISVYLLIGIAFGFLYSFIEMIHPGAIIYNRPESSDISGDMIYFSFVVLTTLGFGDILPVYKLAKVIVMMESVLGVLYIAVMIGRLVGISPTKAKEK